MYSIIKHGSKQLSIIILVVDETAAEVKRRSVAPWQQPVKEIKSSLIYTDTIRAALIDLVH